LSVLGSGWLAGLAHVDYLLDFWFYGFNNGVLGLGFGRGRMGMLVYHFILIFDIILSDIILIWCIRWWWLYLLSKIKSLFHKESILILELIFHITIWLIFRKIGCFITFRFKHILSLNKI
jgi:hypothetical protein